MIHTVAIAGTKERASSLARSYYLRELRTHPYRPLQTLRQAGYAGVAAWEAANFLRGRDLERIIVGFDWILPDNPYAMWQLRPGGWVELDNAIKGAVARGAVRVWQ